VEKASLIPPDRRPMVDVSNTITVTAYRRPDLFRQLLLSLLANALRGWRLHIQVDPSPFCGQFLSIASELLAHCDHVITVNPRRLGVRENPFVLLDRVFSQGSPVNIYLEEDLLVGPDVTNLALWYEKNHRPSWLCLSLLGGTCGSSGLISAPEHPSLLYCSKAFNSIGFIARRNEWQNHFRVQWKSEEFACNHRGEPKTGWDWSIFGHLLRTEGLQSVQPVAARATHRRKKPNGDASRNSGRKRLAGPMATLWKKRGRPSAGPSEHGNVGLA
jgi:hypothetical protein